jgi:hypothetical protein
MKFRRIQVFMGHLEVGEVADLLKGKQKHWAVVQLAPVSYQLYSRLRKKSSSLCIFYGLVGFWVHYTH